MKGSEFLQLGAFLLGGAERLLLGRAKLGRRPRAVCTNRTFGDPSGLNLRLRSHEVGKGGGFEGFRQLRNDFIQLHFHL